jgi:hypothetical protein
MESLVYPFIANYFMEHIEAWLLDTATLKPSCWCRYVNDTFVMITRAEQLSLTRIQYPS